MRTWEHRRAFDSTMGEITAGQHRRAFDSTMGKITADAQEGFQQHNEGNCSRRSSLFSLKCS